MIMHAKIPLICSFVIKFHRAPHDTPMVASLCPAVCSMAGVGCKVKVLRVITTALLLTKRIYYKFNLYNFKIKVSTRYHWWVWFMYIFARSMHGANSGCSLRLRQSAGGAKSARAGMAKSNLTALSSRGSCKVTKRTPKYRMINAAKPF